MKKTLNEFYTLTKPEQHKRLIEIAVVFLKLGTIAFGGPAAHVSHTRKLGRPPGV